MRKNTLAAMLVGLFMLPACAKPIEDIQSENHSERVTASLQFTEGTSPKQIEQLIQILETTEDNGVRASCADALGYARATDAVPALLSTLKVPEGRVRRSTTTALGRIADSRAIDPLIEILNEDITDPNLSEGRRCAIYAFENLKSEKVVPVLLYMLTHNPGRDESERIDYTTALLAALGAQEDKRAIPVLVEFLDGRAGTQAAAALGQIVDVDFIDNTQLRIPFHSPAKANAWLKEHPELWKQKDDEGRQQKDAPDGEDAAGNS